MLVKTDLVRFKWGVLFTLLFSGYMGAISTLMLNGLLKPDQEGDTLVLRAVFDFVYLISLPNFGFFFSRRNMRYLQEDAYTKWMKRLCMMPIDAGTIALSRYLMLAVAFVINMGVFLTLQMMLSDRLQSTFSPLSLIAYVLVLTAYSVVVQTVYIQFELGKHAGGYQRLVFIVMFIILALSVIVALSGGSMMMAVIYIAKHYPWISGLIAAGVIVQTFVIGIAATRNTIRNRDLD
nr:ABC-2 transporter permease [Paenibacillus dendritiformis]